MRTSKLQTIMSVTTITTTRVVTVTKTVEKDGVTTTTTTTKENRVTEVKVSEERLDGDMGEDYLSNKVIASPEQEDEEEEDEEEDEEEEEDEDEDEERYQHALKKHNEQRGMANDLRHQLTVAHKIIESQKDDIKKAVENASHATDIVMEKEKIIKRFQETISDKCKTIDSLYAELGKYQSSRKNRHNQQEVCSANPIHIMKSGKTRILVPSFMEEDEGY